MVVGFWYIIVLSLVHFSLCLEHGPLKWEVEYMFKSPDCVENIEMGINGQFPGPTIRVKEGDTIVVDLVNKLHTEGVVIHWHGIRQIGTPWADGTASISQCAINPGETFQYNFTADKPGTYFYHGHYGMQRSAGLYGSLIVEDKEENPFCKGGKETNCHKYDKEINLLLSDWWHKGVHEQEVGLSSDPYHWIGEPQSLLINGRGQFGCSLTSNKNRCKFPEGKESDCAPEVFKVEPNKIYRLRIASTTALAALNLAIQNKIKGFYKWSINNVSLTLPSTPYLGSLKFKLDNAFNQASPPDYYDRTSYHIVNPNPSNKFDLNAPKSDYDITMPPTNINTIQGSGIYNITSGTTVDVVLQNANMLQKDFSEIHPWHLHGHDFWVLGYGEDKFKLGDEKTFNVKDPPLKNTVAIFPYGWTALRFRADNPGVWAFHCHIEPHLHMGMGVVFAEGIEKIREMKIPGGALACGLTAPKSDGRKARPTPSVLDFVFILFMYYVVTSGFNYGVGIN